MQEILNKLSQREKMIGGGAVVLVVGWLIGLIFGSNTYSSGSGAYAYSYSHNVFNDQLAGMSLGLLAVVAAVAAVVVLYLKYAPNMKINWPAPLPVILLGISAIAAVCAVLILIFGVTNMGKDSICAGSVCATLTSDQAKASGYSGTVGLPILGWIGVIAIVAGAALMVWGAYQEWVASKA